MDTFMHTIAAELVDDANELQRSQFLVDATANGLWNNSQNAAEPFTIFVPLNTHYSPPMCFEEMWNRHRIRGIKRIGGDGVNHQITTFANLVYALYQGEKTKASASGFFVGGASVEGFWNAEFMGCIFHGIAATTLPDIRPMPGQVGRLRTAYLSGEEIELTFLASGLEAVRDQHQTMVISFTQDDRTAITPNRRIPWHGNGTTCCIVIPAVSKTTTRTMLWFALVDNDLKFPLVATTLGWFIEIVPNVNMSPNLKVTDILPKTARSDEELWIKGLGFDETNVRVLVGDNAATVFHCEPSLIRCMVPSGAGVVPIWVANGNIYYRYDSFRYLP